MSIVYTKELSGTIPLSEKNSLQYLLRSWELTRARLHGNWQQFKSSSTAGMCRIVHGRVTVPTLKLSRKRINTN